MKMKPILTAVAIGLLVLLTGCGDNQSPSEKALSDCQNTILTRISQFNAHPAFASMQNSSVEYVSLGDYYIVDSYVDVNSSDQGLGRIAFQCNCKSSGEVTVTNATQVK